MKRNSAWVAALVLATAGAITGGANAFGADVTGPGTGPVTASEHYAKDMSFQEVSKASQGKPGEVAPPCPAASLVIKLKASGLPVGPCDPLPESGAPITLSDDSASDTATAAKDSCAVTYVGSTTAKGVKQIEGTCRSGAVILSSFGHWDDNEPGFPRGYAYIHDMTPAAWPVFTAAIDWDQAPKLDLVYRSGGSSCTSSHCVPFRAVALGGAGCSASPGVTNLTLSGVHITSANSRVDSGCAGRPYNNRLELVCHEMGHAIGLDDRGAGAASCMRTNVPLGNQTDGDGTDFADLSAAYGHDS